MGFSALCEGVGSGAGLGLALEPTAHLPAHLRHVGRALLPVVDHLHARSDSEANGGDSDERIERVVEKQPLHLSDSVVCPVWDVNFTSTMYYTPILTVCQMF